MAHIYLPLIWAKLGCGVRIEDLQQKRFDEALTLLQEHYIWEETLCKASGLASEPESVQSFMAIAKSWLHHSTSLCAVEESSDKLVGLLATSVVYRLHHSLTQARLQLLLFQGEAFHKVMSLLCHMVSARSIFELFREDSYLQYHALCVKPRFRGKGIGVGLLMCGVQLAISLKQLVVAGVFTSERSQMLGAWMSMVTIYEMAYSEWTDEDDEIVFDNPGRGNYSSMLMAMNVPEKFCDTKMYSLGQGL